jgi:hypothetical protein
MSAKKSHPPMKEQATDRRRWNAFVCDDCRAIFRVPADYEGKGIVCPRCDRMLRMPTAQDDLSPVQDPLKDSLNQSAVVVLATPAIPEVDEVSVRDDQKSPSSHQDSGPNQAADQEAPIEKISHSGEWKKRKGKKHSENAEDTWQQPASYHGRKPRLKRKPWWLGPVIGALLMALLWILVSKLRDEKPQEVVVSPQVATPLMPEVITPVDAEKAKSQKKYLQELQQIESSVMSFLTAKSPDEMMRWLRDTPGLREKMAAHYKQSPFTTLGFSSIDQSTIELSEESGSFSATVVTADYDQRQIHLIHDKKEFRIDWESWVGWCEMSFESIRENCTTQPVEIRAMVESEAYYNFDFPKEEEKEWQSYRLVAIDGSTLLHGYVKRGSALGNQLRLFPDEQSRPMILRVRHENEDSQKSQVLIEYIVETGWVKDLPK